RRLAGNALRASDTTESARLEASVGEATRTSSNAGLGPSAAMTVSRRHRSALHVLVSPVRGVDLGDGSLVHAIVFITAPRARVRGARHAAAFVRINSGRVPLGAASGGRPFPGRDR